MENLANKTALITGGSKGIGYGIAEAMLAHDMNVAITSRSLAAAEDAAENLLKGYTGSGKVLAIEANARNYEEQQASVEKTVAEFGSLHVLIANAGVGHFASIEELSLEKWQETIDVNLTGVFYSCKAAVEALKASQGYIITIASLAGTNFFARGTAYNASKFGLVGFTQAMMLDLRHHGIKVSTIMPGSVATYFNGNIPSEKDAWKIQIEDLGQMTIDLLKMNPRTLPSKIEVRPSQPPKR